MLKPYGAKELLDACRRIVQENLAEDVPEAVRHAFSFEPSMLSGGSQAAEKNTEVYADAEDYMRASLDGDGDDGIGSSSLSLELKQLSERRAARKREERKAALREKVRAANRALRAAGGCAAAAAAGGDADRIDEEEAEALAADEAHEHSDDEAADEQAVAANARQFSGALGVLEEDDHDASSKQRRDDFITLGCIGQPNAGKSSLINALAGRKLLSVSITPGHCWGAGTRLLMFDGSVKRVEQIVAAAQRGEEQILMGDDCTPRVVNPASAVQGNTADDAAMFDDAASHPGAVKWAIRPEHLVGYAARRVGADGRYECRYVGCTDRPTTPQNRSIHENNANLHVTVPPVEREPATFLIKSKDPARLQWTCNGKHVLVLAITQKPRRVTKVRRKYVFSVYEMIDSQPYPLIARRGPFQTKAEAKAARREALAQWRTLVFQMSAEDVAALSPKAAAQLRMFQPDHPIVFPPLSDAAAPCSLQARLTSLLRELDVLAPDAVAPSSLVVETAWVLGVWLTDGLAQSATVSQIGLDLTRGGATNRCDDDT